MVSRNADQVLVSLAQKSYYEQLLDAGIQIHLYRKNFLHAKHLSIDGAIAVIGSSNMDIRSFALNAEVSLVVYDAEVTARLREQEERYFATSDRLSQVEWMKRPLAEKICENLAQTDESVAVNATGGINTMAHVELTHTHLLKIKGSDRLCRKLVD